MHAYQPFALCVVYRRLLVRREVDPCFRIRRNYLFGDTIFIMPEMSGQFLGDHGEGEERSDGLELFGSALAAREQAVGAVKVASCVFTTGNSCSRHGGGSRSRQPRSELVVFPTLANLHRTVGDKQWPAAQIFVSADRSAAVVGF